MTDDLIASLSSDLRPVRRGALRSRLALGLAAGAALAAILMTLWLGIRPDLAVAVTTPVFWAKFGFTLLLAALGFWAAASLSRPGGNLRRPALGVVLVVALTGIAGIVQIATAAPAEVRALVLGGSALLCPFYIVALSAPVFVAAILVMRTLAPTNLTLAGFAAGLLAGGAGSWVYAFHCTESGMPFITLWYTAGILAAALIGAATGRYLLRW